MKIFVAGCRGMLARDLIPRLAKEGHRTVCFDLPDLDITRFQKTRSMMAAARPDLLINCAAYTAVDRAESEPLQAFAANRDGPRNLASICSDVGTPLVHLSTDYVFDGRSERPYKEEDSVNPLSVYGQSKWEGEEAVRERLDEHVIVRTSWLFGAHGSNFVDTILRLAREREELRVVSDQKGCPTWTGHVADALTVLARAIQEDRPAVPWGTYHFCGAGPTTWHAFAEAIVEGGRSREALRVQRVTPITTEEYPTPAPRPRWSVLDCAKIRRAFGLEARPWQIGLEETLTEICEGGRREAKAPRTE